jgi:NAD(P)-dependent dehydrogenase (short-subunit alcohol dehydrogenase family)
VFNGLRRSRGHRVQTVPLENSPIRDSQKLIGSKNNTNTDDVGRWNTMTKDDNTVNEWSPNQDALRGKVAVVAGATRGAGRGIAAALGEAGATVICTGRTTRSVRSEYNRPETIEETAELVTHLGGIGIAVAVDHLVPDQVKSLSEKMCKDYGHINVLVNDIWGGEILKGGPENWNIPLWKHDLESSLRILRLAIDTHLITSYYLLPLLINKLGGLLVEVTDGTTEYNTSHYRLSVFYDLAKVAVNRLAFSQGHELESYGATAIAITPGWLRSEMMLDNYGVSEENWRDAMQTSPDKSRPVAPADFALSESPRYVGRAVAALATDPDRARWNRQSVSSGQLASEYGFKDLDGSQPDIWRYIK